MSRRAIKSTIPFRILPPFLPMSPAATASPTSACYRCVSIADHTYALDERFIQAIAFASEVLAQPGASDPVAGFISRSGRLIPVIDLRRRLGLCAPYPTGAVVVVVRVRPEDFASLTIGLCFDAISERRDWHDTVEHGLPGLHHPLDLDAFAVGTALFPHAA